MTKQEIEYAFCWYKKEQWSRLKEIVKDPDDLDDTYQEWRSNAQNSFNMLKNEGVNIKKVQIDTEALLSWANGHNKDVDGATRSEYGAYLLKNRNE